MANIRLSGEIFNKHSRSFMLFIKHPVVPRFPNIIRETLSRAQCLIQMGQKARSEKVNVNIPRLVFKVTNLNQKAMAIADCLNQIIWINS